MHFYIPYSLNTKLKSVHLIFFSFEKKKTNILGDLGNF